MSELSTRRLRIVPLYNGQWIIGQLTLPIISDVQLPSRPYLFSHLSN